jgi:periplasmic protein TonB
MGELGNLSQCMMDGDLEGLGRARGIRQKALLASGALELSLFAALLLWPLITPGILSNRVLVMPIPPFHGMPQTQVAPQRTNQSPTTQNPRVPIPIFVTFLHPPQRNVSEISDAEPPSAYGPSIPGTDVLGPVLPGGSDRVPATVVPPRPAANAGHPLQVNSGVMQAALIYRVEPVYPAIAKAIHLEGTVNLRAIIRTNGSVGDLTLVNGNPILGLAAMAAVREWRYKPTLLSGQPVDVETIVTVNFSFE